MTEGIIEIRIQDITPSNTIRIKKIIHTLIEQGVFTIRNGNATLHFDETGDLGSIEMHFKKWKKQYERV